MKNLFLLYLNASFFGSVIILIGLLIRPFLKKAPRRILCIVWLLAAVRLLLPFNLESHFSLQPQYVPSESILSQQGHSAQLPTENEAMVPVQPSVDPIPKPDTDMEQLPQDTPVFTRPAFKPDSDATPIAPEVPIVKPEAPVVPDLPALKPDAPERPSISPVTTSPGKTIDTIRVISVVWMTVVVAVVAYGFVSYRVLKHRVRRAIRCDEGILECEKINTAFLLGYFKPKIYLPSGLNQQDRAFIIAHERIHIARGDHWWKLLGIICVSLHWFNPLVLLGYVLMCRDVEIACDECVVRSMNLEDRKAYSMALLNSGKRLSGILVCPVAFGEVSLKQRIKKVLTYRSPGYWITAFSISLVTFVAICFLTSPTAKPEENSQPKLQASETNLSTKPGDETDGEASQPTENQPTETKPTRPSEPVAPPPTEPEPSPTDPTEPVEPPTDPTEPVEPPTHSDETPHQKPPQDDNVIDSGSWNGGLTLWKLTKDGTLTITGKTHIHSMSVYPWAEYSDLITKAVVEDGVTTIPSLFFSEMKNLKEVYLSNTLTVLGEKAFCLCPSLQSITIPAGVTEILPYTFYGCTSLEELNFAPDCTLTTIHKYAFAKSGLTSLSTPASLRTIDFHAFENCESLQTVILQGGVQELKAYCFQNCINLRHIVLGESIQRGHVNFEGCYAIETLEIYTDAKFGGFEDRKSLRSVIVGGNATDLYGFDGCTALSEVIITAPIETIDSFAFNGCTALSSFTIPDTVTEIGNRAFSETGLTRLVIPAGVKELGRMMVGPNKINEIVFLGDCPTGMNTLKDVTANVYYPADNETWTERNMEILGTNLTWIPYYPDEGEVVP